MRIDGPKMAIEDRRGRSILDLLMRDPYYRKWTIQTGHIFQLYRFGRVRPAKPLNALDRMAVMGLLPLQH